MRFYQSKNLVTLLVFLSAVFLPFVCGSFLSTEQKAVFYAMSLTIKECLVFFLPFVIFSLVFHSISRLGARAIRLMMILLPLICVSNFFNTELSYGISKLWSMKGCDFHVADLGQKEQGLVAAFSFHLTPFFSSNVALLSGFAFGLFFGIFLEKMAVKASHVFHVWTRVFFRLLLPFMPLFIVGTTLKLQHDGMLRAIFEKYLPVLFIFVIATGSWVLLQYFLLAKGNFGRMQAYLRNVFPAMITAFSSMSSVAALPFSLKAAEKNSAKPHHADIVMPSTVNVHLVGDCFFIPMVAIAVMQSFEMPFPHFCVYLPFAFHFVLAKFAVAGVPGGGVLVMLPILEKYLGLTSDMLAIVMALYILFDPIITTCNVAGNGALAILFDRIMGCFEKKSMLDDQPSSCLVRKD